MILETSVFQRIVSFISSIAKVIGFNWIAIIAFGLLLLTIVISFVCTMFSIDAKTSKAVQQINLYLEKNPYVNEENLVEFNKLMKRIPAPMRTQWQQYMVGRDKKPSQYFTDENCIDKPFKSSSYASHIMAVKVLIVCISILAFVFSVGAISEGSLAQILLQSVLISGLVAILGAIYVLFLKSRRSALLFELYYNFTNLKNYLDRAVTTLPDYIDYEILFTKKEISAGIPVLQEYLKQRAEYEQQQIEHAKASQVEHEQYDFSVLGVDAAIIMEKAMRECEYMLGNKKRILSEISELQSNLDSYERTYDEKLKGTQRKLRDIQESLDRLKEKLQSTTNMIVGNDLRKQRENEIEKQRQVEKESAEDTRKFEESKKKLLDQIDAKKAEIEEFRKNAEAVLTDEFKAYSNKIYNELKNIADEQVKDELATANNNIQGLQAELENKERILVEKTTLLNEQMDVEGYASELQSSYEELSNAYDEVLKELDNKDKEIAALNARLGENSQDQDIENFEQEPEQAVETEQVAEEAPIEVEPEQEPIPQNYNGLSSFFAGSELTEEELYGEPVKEEVVEEPEQVVEPEPEQATEPEQVAEQPVEEKPVEAQEGAPLTENDLFSDDISLDDILFSNQPAKEEIAEPEKSAKEEKEVSKHESPNANALTRENEILSKQLKNTQEILKAIVKGKSKKKSSKKLAEKKSAEKKKPADKKPADKKPVEKKKPADKKKAPAKKTEDKKKEQKPKAKKKTASSKYADKPWSEREEAKPVEKKPKSNKKKKSDNGNGNDDNGKVADLSLEQFNEQLRNAFSDIVSNQGNDEK